MKDRTVAPSEESSPKRSVVRHKSPLRRNLVSSDRNYEQRFYIHSPERMRFERRPRLPPSPYRSSLAELPAVSDGAATRRERAWSPNRSSRHDRVSALSLRYPSPMLSRKSEPYSVQGMRPETEIHRASSAQYGAKSYEREPESRSSQQFFEERSYSRSSNSQQLTRAGLPPRDDLHHYPEVLEESKYSSSDRHNSARGHRNARAEMVERFVASDLRGNRHMELSPQSRGPRASPPLRANIRECVGPDISRVLSSSRQHHREHFSPSHSPRRPGQIRKQHGPRSPATATRHKRAPSRSEPIPAYRYSGSRPCMRSPVAVQRSVDSTQHERLSSWSTEANHAHAHSRRNPCSTERLRTSDEPHQFVPEVARLPSTPRSESLFEDFDAYSRPLIPSSGAARDNKGGRYKRERSPLRDNISPPRKTSGLYPREFPPFHDVYRLRKSGPSFDDKALEPRRSTSRERSSLKIQLDRRRQRPSRSLGNCSRLNSDPVDGTSPLPL